MSSPDFPRPRDFAETVWRRTRNPMVPDSGYVYVNDMSGLSYAYSLGLCDETSPGFLNGWDNVGSPSLPLRFALRNDGNVDLEGFIEGGTTGTVVFTLPAGYRPEYTVRFTVPADEVGTTSLVQVDPDGDVSVVA